jgi:hypothetical protein
MFVVPGLGLLGAYFDIYTGWTVLTAISKTHSDYNEFASEYPLVAWFLGLLFPDLYSNAEQASHVFETAALLLLGFGLIGGLVSVLFVLGRLTKALAVVLLICAVAPMFHHPAEFMGLPMALAGLLGLLVRDKTKA